MALTHATSVRNGLADYAVDQLDTGTTDASADLVFMTSGDVEVATCVMSNPAFGAASSGTATAAAISDDTSATGGTVALYKVQNRDNTEQWRGTVTATGGGGDFEMSTLTVPAGITVTVTSFTYTASP